jgi:hypothetical protein
MTMQSIVWSIPVNEISARVSVALEDLGAGLRHAIYVELRNHALRPIAIASPPRVNGDLADASGQPVTPSGLTISGPIPERQWAMIPRDAYVGLRVDMQNVGVPSRAQGVALIAVGGKVWQVAAGRYSLRVAVAFEPHDGAPARPWTGRLELPPVRLVIEPDVLHS